jgi:hypothetical protein|tara:strand:- start:1550 stop:1999 length:450 start_codon:yes stop_codon:yes gene_type:complete
MSVDFLTPNTEDWDTSDELIVTYSADGGATTGNVLAVQSISDGDAFNAPAAIDYGFDGEGDVGFELPALIDDVSAGVGSLFQTFTSDSIGVSATTMDVVFQFNGLTSAAEGLYLDNITFIDVSKIPEPNALSLVIGFLGMSIILVRRRA